MDSSEHGKICDPCIQKYVEWKIENYLSKPQKVDTLIKSPVFHFLNASWYLRLYPNGERNSGSVEHLSIYLCREDAGNEDILIDYTIGIKSGKTWIKGSSSYGFMSDEGHGWPKFMKRYDICRRESEILPNGELTVSCLTKHINSVVHSSSQTELLDGVSTLCEDFQSLLSGEKKSDVTIKVENQTFKAHKLILGARSSVFSAMFEHGMRENCTGVINIEDCDPEIFKEFLAFIYTEKIDNLSSHNVTALFSLADKYDVRGLREESIAFMKDNLCLDTVCDVLSAAYKHNETELMKGAKELLVKNIKKVMSSPRWFSFLQECPAMGTEIMKSFIP